MNEKDDLELIYKTLDKNLKKYKIPLAEQINVKTKDPFFVLIATILSSRTKDKTTALVCDHLFKKIKNPNDLIKIEIKTLEKTIYPVGFYKTKAKNLKKLGFILKGKKIPSNLEELLKLPGVGRKTASLVLSTAFKKDAICVDTHVHRITNRIGIVETKNPTETEIELKKTLPIKLWNKTNYLFVILGQNICFPRNPNCKVCPIEKYCKKKGVFKK